MTTISKEDHRITLPPVDSAGQLAQMVFRSFVSKAIGKKDFDAVLTPPRTQQVNFEIAETYTIAPEARMDRVAGTPDGQEGRDRWVTKDSSSYNALIAKEIAELRNDEQVFDLCLDQIKRYEYVQNRAATGMLTVHPPRRRIMHHFGCGNCAQTGRVRCHGCGATGKTTCIQCSGRGKRTCSSCNGSGNHQRTVYVTRQGVSVAETHYESCSSCYRTGLVNCYGCYQSGQVTCGTCGGHCYLTCNPCEGSGWQTDITRVAMMASYGLGRYLHQDADVDKDIAIYLEKMGYDAVPIAASAMPVYHTIDRVNRSIVVRHPFQAPRTVYHASVSDVSAEIRHFGHHANIVDASGILDHLVGQDIAKFAEDVGIQAAKRRLDVNALDHCMMQIFRTGIARDIVTAAGRENMAADEIWTAVHRSVSVENVESFIASLNTALRLHRTRRLFAGAMWGGATGGLLSFGLAYMGTSEASVAALCGTTLAMAVFGMSGSRLTSRIAASRRKADLANFDEHGVETTEAASREGVDQLLCFARNRKLLFTKGWAIAALVSVGLLTFYSASAGEGMFKDFAYRVVDHPGYKRSR